MAVSGFDVREICMEEAVRHPDINDVTTEAYYRVGMRCLIDVAGERADREYWDALARCMRMRAEAGPFGVMANRGQAGERFLFTQAEGERLLGWYDRWREVAIYLRDHDTPSPVALSVEHLERRIEEIRHMLIAHQYLFVSREALLETVATSTGLLLGLLGPQNALNFAEQFNALLPRLRSTVLEIGPNSVVLN